MAKYWRKPSTWASSCWRLTFELQGWPYACLEEVAAACHSIRQANHDVDVRDRSAAVVRHVTDEREHLDLFVDDDALVLLPHPVEVAEHDVAQRSNRSESSGRDRAFAREGE